jgi:hypothetical protein
MIGGGICVPPIPEDGEYGFQPDISLSAELPVVGGAADLRLLVAKDCCFGRLRHLDMKECDP